MRHTFHFIDSISKNNFIQFILFFLIIIDPVSNLSLNNIPKNDIINLSPYKYPHPENETSPLYTIAILCSNDIHGYALSKEHINPITNEKYNIGGVELLGNLVETIRNEWKERFIWLDGGDQGGEGYEFLLSNGTIMSEFFNIKNLSATTLGNHDGNYGYDFLKNYMSQCHFDFLIANIQQKNTNKKEFLPHQIRTKIYNVGEVKLGIIGLTHKKIGIDNKRLSDIQFLDYFEIIIEEGRRLRKEGADCVILLAHFGPKCLTRHDDEYVLKMHNIYDYHYQQCTETDGVIELLNRIPPNTIDLFVSGHIHENMFYWINNIPFVSAAKGDFANIAYVHFYKNKKLNKFYLDSVEIEGPVPLCTKVFKNGKNCDYHFAKFNLNEKEKKELQKKLGPLVQFKFHDQLMQYDNETSKYLNKYKNILFPYQKEICYTEIFLERSNMGDNTLVNLLADIIRNATHADISLLNINSIRSSWKAGIVRLLDIYNMFPFKDILCTSDLYGYELLKLFVNIEKSEKLFGVSGLKVFYQRNPRKFIDAFIYETGEKIDINKLYKVATYKYLWMGNAQFSSVMKWLQLRNYECHITASEAIIASLEKIKVIKEGDFYSKDNPRNVFIN